MYNNTRSNEEILLEIEKKVVSLEAARKRDRIITLCAVGALILALVIIAAVLMPKVNRAVEVCNEVQTLMDKVDMDTVTQVMDKVNSLDTDKINDAFDTVGKIDIDAVNSIMETVNGVDFQALTDAINTIKNQISALGPILSFFGK